MFKPLRDKILKLAISGKLVPQLDSEPTVEQIGPAPAKDEEPFALPEKWKWVQLEQVAQYRPSVKAEDELEVSFAPLEKLSDGYNNFFCFDLIEKWGEVKKGFSRFCDGDVIFAKIHPSFQNRKSAVVTRAHNGIGCGSTEYCVFRCKEPLDNQYLLWFFKSDYFISFGKNTFKGTVGQQRVNLDVITTMYFPLPPIEEQRRIVSKLDDIMGNLERMDQAYTELSGPMAKHFKNLVLQQAISGQLVPQLDSEPAVEQIGLAPAKEEEPFALPEKWKWVKAGQLGFWKAGGTPSRSNPAFWNEGTINWIKTGELNDGIINCVEEKISQEGFNNSSTHLNPVGAVLIAMYGATIGRLGVLAVPSTTNQACCACTVNKDLVDNWFLFFVLMGLRPLLIKQGAGSAQPNISKDKLVNQWVPLPPLEEQRRIVARIEELFGDVDKLLEWQQFA